MATLAPRLPTALQLGSPRPVQEGPDKRARRRAVAPQAGLTEVVQRASRDLHHAALALPHRLAADPTTAPHTAAVVGGGPVGLAAALTLRDADFDVTVFEKREYRYDRPVHFNVRAEFIGAVRRLGVHEQLFAGSGAARHIRQLNFKDETSMQRVQRAFAASDAPGDLAQDSCRAMLSRRSVAQVRLRDLERALYTRAVARGVRIEHIAEAAPLEGLPRCLTYSTPRHQGVLYPDLVVAADGARSQTRAQVGIASEELPARTHFIAGVIAMGHAVSSTLTRRVDVNESGAFERQICVGHGSSPDAWVLVEVPANVLPLLTTAAERRAYYLAKASLVLEEAAPGRPLVTNPQILWGGEQPFEVVQRRVDTAVSGRTLLIGDAVGTGHFLTSGGINTALAFHIPALADAARAIRDPWNATEAGLARYDRVVRGATEAWLEVGKDEFVAKAPVNFGRDFLAPR